MEQERFASGYCRRLDGSRTVELILTDGRLTEADCDYGQCLYQSGCPIARAIREMEQEARPDI